MGDIFEQIIETGTSPEGTPVVRRTITFTKGKTVFKSGLNFTVRRDAAYKQATIGEYIKVQQWDGYGQIAKIYNCKLADLPQEVVQNNHDPSCNSVQGEIKMYREIYPDLAKMSEAEAGEIPVVCIGFYLYPGNTPSH